MSMRDRLRGARPAPAACAALCVAMGGRRAGCWRRRGSAPRAGDDGPPRSSVRPTRHSPPHGDIADADVAAAAAGRAARFSYGVIAKHAALNDQQFSGGQINQTRAQSSCARGARRPIAVGSGATRDPTDPLAPPAGRRRRFFFREIPVRANADDDVVVAAAAGGRAAPWTAMSMRDRLRGARPAPAACAALCVAMGGRRAGCWRRRGSAPRAGDDGPPRSSVRPTRHSPPHGDIADADVAAAAAGRAARFSYGVIAKHAALNDQQFSGACATMCAPREVPTSGARSIAIASINASR